MSEISNTKNVKRLSTPINYMFGSEDDVLDIDTTGGIANIYLPNILESGSLLVRKRIYINDVGNNASVNNINIITLGGDKINSLTTLPLDVNGISTEIVITNRTEYIANLSTDNGGGGGIVTGADNGLTLVGTTIKLGGTLLAPTTIDALGSNTFSVNDQQGLFMKTRDAQGNFFFNNIGGTGTLIGSSQYIFSYLGDGGNVFEDSLIVINFGGANNIKRSTDFWNFGDYQTSDSSISIFNFGRFNEYYNSVELFVNGFNNIFSSFATANIFGSYNTISNGGDLIVIGAYNTIIGESQKIIIGNNNQNLVVDGTNGYVGIGTSTPSAKLDVRGQIIAGPTGNITSNDSPFYAVRTNLGSPNYYTGYQFAFEVGGGYWGIGFNYANDQYQFLGGSTAKFIFGYGNPTTPHGKFIMDMSSGYFGANTTTPLATIHGIGLDSTASNYALKVDNSASSPLLYVRNDAFVSINQNTIGVARLEITGGAGAVQGIYTQTTASISINGNDTTGIGVKGQATTGVGLQGNIGGAVGSALKLDDNVNGILLMKVGSNGTKSIINVINLPTSNAGLSSGDMYVDTAVNILANGDKVVGWKV